MADQTSEYHSKLNRVMRDEEILKSDLHELKQALLWCAEMRESRVLNPLVIEGIPKREKFIRELIQVKLREHEIKQSGSKLVWVIILGVANLVFVGLNFMSGYERKPTDLEPTVEVQSESPSPAVQSDETTEPVGR